MAADPARSGGRRARGTDWLNVELRIQVDVGFRGAHLAVYAAPPAQSQRRSTRAWRVIQLGGTTVEEEVACELLRGGSGGDRSREMDFLWGDGVV